MTDEQALIAAIIASPDDDLPRIVLADFLDERGQPGDAARAEFIRLQVEIATLKDCRHPLDEAAKLKPRHLACRLCKLRLRERNMWRTKKLIPALQAGLPVVSDGVSKPKDKQEFHADPGGRMLYHFRRGFAAAVETPTDMWLQYADELLAAHPVAEVTLLTPVETEGRYVGSGVDGRIEMRLAGRSKWHDNTPTLDFPYSLRCRTWQCLALEWPSVRSWKRLGNRWWETSHVVIEGEATQAISMTQARFGVATTRGLYE